MALVVQQDGGIQDILQRDRIGQTVKFIVSTGDNTAQLLTLTLSDPTIADVVYNASPLVARAIITITITYKKIGSLTLTFSDTRTNYVQNTFVYGIDTTWLAKTIGVGSNDIGRLVCTAAQGGINTTVGGITFKSAFYINENSTTNLGELIPGALPKWNIYDTNVPSEWFNKSDGTIWVRLKTMAAGFPYMFGLGTFKGYNYSEQPYNKGYNNAICYTITDSISGFTARTLVDVGIYLGKGLKDFLTKIKLTYPTADYSIKLYKGSVVINESYAESNTKTSYESGEDVFHVYISDAATLAALPTPPTPIAYGDKIDIKIVFRINNINYNLNQIALSQLTVTSVDERSPNLSVIPVSVNGTDMGWYIPKVNVNFNIADPIITVTAGNTTFPTYSNNYYAGLDIVSKITGQKVYTGLIYQSLNGVTYTTNGDTPINRAVPPTVQTWYFKVESELVPVKGFDHIIRIFAGTPPAEYLAGSPEFKGIDLIQSAGTTPLSTYYAEFSTEIANKVTIQLTEEAIGLIASANPSYISIGVEITDTDSSKIYKLAYCNESLNSLLYAGSYDSFYERWVGGDIDLSNQIELFIPDGLTFRKKCKYKFHIYNSIDLIPVAYTRY